MHVQEPHPRPLNEEVRYKQQRSNTRNAMKSLPPVRVFKGSAQGTIWRQILKSHITTTWQLKCEKTIDNKPNHSNERRSAISVKSTCSKNPKMDAENEKMEVISDFLLLINNITILLDCNKILRKSASWPFTKNCRDN